MREAMIEQSRLNEKGVNARGRSAGFRGDQFKLGGCRAYCEGSWLGGIQGEQGYFFGMEYGPGSFVDRVIETYAGPHDYLNNPFFYNELGNNVARPAAFALINAANVAIATPFAVASVIPSYTYGVLQD